MAQANPFDQFDSQAQPVPVQALQPIIGSVTPEEQARKAREEARQEEANARANAADARAAAAEERAAAKFAATGGAEGAAVPVAFANEAKAGVSQFTSLTRALNTFKDDFGGNPLGGLENVTEGSILGVGTEGQSEWWADFKSTDNLIRNTLFGASLTEGEKAAYNATTITPAMRPDKIRANLQRRAEIIQGALQREREFFIANGYKPDAVDVLFRPVMQEGPTEEAAVNAPAQAPATRDAAAGEAFLTEQDKELQAKLSQAYASGATLAELQALAQPYGQTIPIASQEELDAARAQGRGIVVTPTGMGVPDPREEMGFFEGALETVTGSERSTPEVDALPDWTTMPELNSLSVDSFQAALGTMITNPQESVAIIRAQFPGVQVRQDEKGNFILRSSADGQEYAIKPGFRVSDIPRALGGLAAFTPAGRATTAGGAAISGGLTQAGIEASQAATGGEFNAEEVLLASGGNVLGQQIGRGVNAVRNARAARTAAPEVAPVQPAPMQPAPAAAQPAAMADELAVPTLTAETQTEVGTIAREAIGRGKNAKDAQAKLAIMAQVDHEARAAAERLGIELPVDVLSNDARLLTVTGLARSQIGSEAQTAWGQTVSQAIQQSDDTLRAIGATRDLGQVSETVRNRLVKDIDNLEADAGVLRREVDDAIDVQGRVEAKSLQAQLTKTINDLGGIDEAKQAFSAEEKKLLAMLGEGEQAKMPTYARLNQVRDQVGRALFKNQGPWVDAPTATLKRYYGALADDQIAHIEAVAGKEIADKMRGSNDLYSQMFKARESMKTVYGKSLEKDIGPLIKTAITTGAKGNGEALRKLMAAVPEDLRPQAVLSGIFSLAERQSAQRGFSFAEYAKLYSGLRQNSPVYAEIAKTIGKENEVILRDLYSISKRVAMAENKIVRTGASNQPLLNALNAEGLVSKLAAGAVRRGAVTGGTALAGGVAGGPVGAVVGGGIADALQQSASQAGKSNLDKLHSVLASEPFKDLVEKVADGTVKPADVNRTANDKSFRRFATTVLGIKDFDGRKNWLQSAMTVGAPTQATPEQQPTSKIEVR
jgi:hypothetical protein